MFLKQDIYCPNIHIDFYKFVNEISKGCYHDPGENYKGILWTKWHDIVCKRSPFSDEGGFSLVLFNNPNLMVY